MAGRLRRLYVGGDQARTRWRLRPVRYGANKWGLRPEHFGARVPGTGAKFRELTRKPLASARGGSLDTTLRYYGTVLIRLLFSFLFGFCAHLFLNWTSSPRSNKIRSIPCLQEEFFLKGHRSSSLSACGFLPCSSSNPLVGTGLNRRNMRWWT